MPSLDLNVGPQQITDGSKIIYARGGRTGELCVSEVHGRYAEQALRKNTFFSYCAAQAMTQAATGLVGNIIWNPPQSGVNLALTKWSIACAVTSASVLGFVLAFGSQTTTPTGLTVSTASGSTFLTQPTLTQPPLAQQAIAGYAAATVLVAPIAVHLLAHNTAAIATTGEDSINGDLEGSFIVPPGGFAAICTLGATAAASAIYSSVLAELIPL